MSIIAEIRALLPLRKKKSDTDEASAVQAAEMALGRLAAEKTAAQAAIRKAADTRVGLLLTDGTDSEITQLDLDVQRHSLTLERLEALRPELVKALQAARGQHRQFMLLKLVGDVMPAVTKYSQSARETSRHYAAVVALRQSAISAGIEAEFQTLLDAAPPLLNMGDLSLLNIWEGTTEKRVEAFMRPAPRPAPPLPKPAKPPEKQQAEISLQPAPSPDAPPAPRPRRMPKQVPGGTRVRVLRSGLETVDGVQCRAGDEITMSPENAKLALLSGGVSIVEEGDTP